MRLKALICDVLAREFYYWSALSEHTIDIELLSSKNHEYPSEIKKDLQNKINDLESQSELYDYIIIGFGLCGKVLDGIESINIPFVVPRAHDCITLFMGSKEKFGEYFRDNPGAMYYIESWIERNGMKHERKELDSIGLGGNYDDYVKKYGEEGADYLISLANEWKSRYNKAVYISNDLANDLVNIDFSHEVKLLSEKRNWKYEEREGDFRLIKKMVYGDWNIEEFLVVPSKSKVYHTVNSRIIDYTKLDNDTIINSK